MILQKITKSLVITTKNHQKTIVEVSLRQYSQETTRHNDSCLLVSASGFCGEGSGCPCEQGVDPGEEDGWRLWRKRKSGYCVVHCGCRGSKEVGVPICFLNCGLSSVMIRRCFGVSGWRDQLDVCWTETRTCWSQVDDIHFMGNTRWEGILCWYITYLPLWMNYIISFLL